MSAAEDVEALAAEIGCPYHGPDYGVCVECGSAAERVLDSDWLAARDARLLAEVERERDEAREQGNKLADGLYVWRDQCEAAEAETARLSAWVRDAVGALRAATAISERMHRTGVVEGLNLGNHDRLIREAEAVLAAERDPEAGEGRG